MLCLKRDGQLRREKEQFLLVYQDLEWFLRGDMCETHRRKNRDFLHDYFIGKNNEKMEQE